MVQPIKKYFSWKGLGDILLLGSITALIMSLLARKFWFCELATHFMVQYTIAISIAIIIFIVYKCRYRWRLASIFLLYFICQILPLYLPYLTPPHLGEPTTPPPHTTTKLRLLSFNVHSYNPQHEAVIQFLRTTPSDIVLLLEVTSAWGKRLASLKNIYPHQTIIPRGDNFGIAMLSRIAPIKIEQNNFGMDVPSLIGHFQHEDKDFIVIGTHPIPPMNAECLQDRNCQMGAIADYAANCQINSKAVLIAGDLNCTSWSPYFQDWLKQGRLKDSRIGYGILSSWPNYYFWFWIPIDHFLASHHIIVAHRQVFSDSYGSDHFPIQIEFSLAK